MGQEGRGGRWGRRAGGAGGWDRENGGWGRGLVSIFIPTYCIALKLGRLGVEWELG